MNRIIIVSKGKELIYAQRLLDLFVTRTEESAYFSSLGKENIAEVYSEQTYLHSSIPKKSFKVFVGTIKMSAEDRDPVYEKNGLSCYIGKETARLIVDEKKARDNYAFIYSELQKLEKKYFEEEKEYVELTGREESQLLNLQKKLLSSKSKQVTLQAYLCLAYIVYFYLSGVK